MAKNWWEEGIPEEGADDGSGGGAGTGYTWWQRELPPRFFIKSGQKRELSFVDESCFRIWEHQFWIDGRPGFATCTKKIRGHCPLCDAKNKAYSVGFFTIIDHTGYEDREGIEHKDYLALLPAKHFSLETLRGKYEDHGGLAGKRFNVRRSTNQTAATIGDDWNYLRDVDIPEEAEPLDYKSILEPLSDDQMRDIVKVGEWRGKTIVTTTSPGSGESYREDADYDDDESSVPF